jgi:hypothetical protein
MQEEMQKKASRTCSWKFVKKFDIVEDKLLQSLGRKKSHQLPSALNCFSNIWQFSKETLRQPNVIQGKK